MEILIADDEIFALESLEAAVRAADPSATIHAFQKTSALLEYIENHTADVAFLDIEMRGTTGLFIGQALMEKNPGINIIFVTGHTKYSVDAFALRASGYLLKPVTARAVAAELEQLRNPLRAVYPSRIRVHTFGNFEIFVDDQPVVFSRSKCRELLAYLIDRRGASCTTREIAAILWEDKLDSPSTASQTRTLVSELLLGLRRVNAQHILQKSRGHLAVLTHELDCDYYRFLEGDPEAMSLYNGEYMSAYSWAEFTTAFLSSPKK